MRRAYLGLAFVLLMGVISIFDAIRWDYDAKDSSLNMFKLYTWLIPGIYCAVFLLLPAFFGKLNQPEAVPERVTH